MVNGMPFWFVWVGFGLYAFLLAPPDRPDTFALIEQLVRGDIAGINPTIVSLFNLMGVWPCVFGCVLFSDGRGQKVPAWPFVTLSMAVGAFALLPYFALRQENPRFEGVKNGWIRLTDSRVTGFVLLTATIGLLVYGLRYGSWTDFVTQWRTSRFIHVMSLDFMLLSALFPWILHDDMERRGLSEQSWIFVLVSSIPLIGPVIYLTLRPNLPEPRPAPIESP